MYSDSEGQSPGGEMTAGIESCVVGHENPQDDHCVIVRNHYYDSYNNNKKKTIFYFNI